MLLLLFCIYLIVNSKGKLHNEKICLVIFNSIIESTDPISDILLKREEWIQCYVSNAHKNRVLRHWQH